MNTNSFLTKMQQPNKPCLHPWFYLWINAAGDATVCPQNKTRLGSLENHSMQDIWQGENLKKIRQHFVNEEYELAGCEKECPYLRGTFEHSKVPIPVRELIFPDFCLDSFEKDSTAYTNIQNCSQEYTSASVSSQNQPVVLDCQTILACNADCIMCGQPHSSTLKHSSVLKYKLIQSSQYLASIRWQGGEVFLDKQFISDLQNVSDSGNSALKKVIITNASVITPSQIDTILAMPGKVQFIISMDGATKTTVDKIRFKLKYEKIFSVITYLAKKQKSLTKESLVLWNYTVMFSNLTDVLSAIKISNELGISLNLAAIQGKYPQENFFEYPLITAQEWKAYIDAWDLEIKNSSTQVSGLEGLIHRYSQTSH